MSLSDKTAAQILAEAAAKVNGVNNFECEMIFKAQLQLKGNIVVDNQMSNYSTIFQDQAKIQIITSIFGMRMTQTSYWAKAEDKHYAFTNEKGVWKKEEIKFENYIKYLESFFLLLNFTTFFKNKEAFTKNGTVKLNNINCLVLEGSLKGEAVRAAINLLVSPTMLGVLGEKDEYFDGLPGFHMTAYIKEETGEVYKIFFDLTELEKKIIKNASQDQKQAPALLSGSTEFIFHAYNNSKDVTVPQEVLDACQTCDICNKK